MEKSSGNLRPVSFLADAVCEYRMGVCAVFSTHDSLQKMKGCSLGKHRFPISSGKSVGECVEEGKIAFRTDSDVLGGDLGRFRGAGIDDDDIAPQNPRSWLAVRQNRTIVEYAVTAVETA